MSLRLPSLLLLATALAVPAADAPIGADYPVQPVPFTAVKLTGGMWQQRQETNRTITVPFALDQCESTKRMANFDLAAETMKRRAAGETAFQNKPGSPYPFDDSDAYKAIEAASYSLSQKADPALAKRLEGLIARIAAAQEPDGYLYTWRTMHPDKPCHDWIDAKRWLKDPDLSHELYNIGHLYEAGTAHAAATGSKTLLDVCLKSAELVHKDFGVARLPIAPGHQVIEMGLSRLYRTTGDPRYIALAKYFLDVRGPDGSSYNQRHQKVLDQKEAVGHAVRACYMYAGMADVAALTGDRSYLDAITAIWNNAAGRKLHLTGGVGARGSGEAFGDDYELQSNCYNETCAAIANMMWNQRMFLMSGDAKYMDVYERTAYNGFLSGVSLSGDRFFYPNPLEYDGKSKNNHGHAGRAPWFGCACCPPNVARYVAAFSGGFYAVRDQRLMVTLFGTSTATATVQDTAVTLEQKTGYPWDGRIRLSVSPAKAARFSLCVRVPGWVRGRPVPTDLYAYPNAVPAAWSVAVGSERVTSIDAQGFAVIDREWKAGDVVDIDFPMPVQRVAAHPKAVVLADQVAFERGPIVFCVEGIDNDGSVFDYAIPDSATVSSAFKADLLGGVSTLSIAGAKRVKIAEDGKRIATAATLTAIPYQVWNNRGASPMQVWFQRNEANARPPLPPTLASTASVTTSESPNKPLPDSVLNDGLMPLNATDGFASFFHWWPAKDKPVWIQYTFAKPERVSEGMVMLFSDLAKGGGCGAPASWRLTYLDGTEWKPVTTTSTYGTEPKVPQRIVFTPVTTTAMRLEVQLHKDWSAGLYEWQVK